MSQFHTPSTRNPLLNPFSSTLQLLGSIVLLSTALFCRSQAADSTATESPLRLNDLRRMVLEQNDQIQMRMQDAEVSERLHRAEKGIFEPQLVGGAEYFDTSRPNNRQQSAQLGFFARPFYLERNTLYNAGIEFLLGTGAKLRIGYMLRDLNNNVGAAEATPRQLMGQQYESFAGLNLTQPLLKNAGWGATTAKIRLSAISSKIAFNEYRRQILLVLASAEAAYWDLHLAQEQVRIGTDSLETAKKILKDNQARVEVGKSSELEVMQAQAGLAARKAKLEQAQQTAFDYASRISSLYSRTLGSQQRLPKAVDVPELVDDPTSKVESYTQAFRKNPDYIIRLEQVKQERLRVAYLKNQRLPQLDLKASYGLNGLSSNIVQSMDDWAGREYPAWSVGFEFRIPLGGGIKERNELEAGKLGKIRALAALKEAEVQVFNLVDTALRKIDLHRNSLTNARSVIGFHEKLLAAPHQRPLRDRFPRETARGPVGPSGRGQRRQPTGARDRGEALRGPGHRRREHGDGTQGPARTGGRPRHPAAGPRRRGGPVRTAQAHRGIPPQEP